MTSSDEAPRDDQGPSGADLPLDEDAAWRDIVSHFGERAVLDQPTVDGAQPPVEPSVEGPVADRRPEPAVEATAVPRAESRPEPEVEHFVPPEPPPLPRPTPARRLAWGGLFVPPVLLLVAVFAGWTFPMWLSVGLVLAFVGGFVFLVATMPRERHDGWDDGAVV